jgi:hypothetical protein
VLVVNAPSLSVGDVHGCDAGGSAEHEYLDSQNLPKRIRGRQRGEAMHFAPSTGGPVSAHPQQHDL